MKYYSEQELAYFLNTRDLDTIMVACHPINVRLCRNCEYFIQDHPTINTDGDFGYCEYRTDFCVLDDEPIDWYFIDINGFCNEDDIGENDKCI